ncbi:TnsD family Tn7-like transposition protein [Cupriavidus sp. 8B]
MGCTCADVARLCRISIDAVYRYVRKNHLRAHINAAQRRRLTVEARTVWLRLLRRFPRAAANRLERIEPRAFRWLYRNDIVWLREHWPDLPVRRQSKRADATAPHGQDAAMCARIRMARKVLKADSSSRRPSLAALCRQLGVTEYGLQRARRWRRVEKAVRDYLGSTNE